MKIYLDTDIHSKIATRTELAWVQAAIISKNIEVVISDTIIEEILLTTQPRLQQIGKSIYTFLEGKEIVAPLNHQIGWSVPLFLRTPTNPFQVFRTYQNDLLKQI